ncbi:hypothetical protein [Culicoidibacter larvae]|uniref:Uncharacterized protein n=1 Tax=Culicoidibacter larvae TaxID=2579976 RepID=A0A5R8Q8M9_9FIRM|nr:hypothetical protein [Culicoidibacter larvae]TLG72061.1 hypothetical protein FEZ08_09515 [Culicoidibacter larvae]
MPRLIKPFVGMADINHKEDSIELPEGTEFTAIQTVCNDLGEGITTYRTLIPVDIEILNDEFDKYFGHEEDE